MHIEGNVSRVVAFFALLLGAGCSAGGLDAAGEDDGPAEAQLALDQDGECLVSDEVVGHACLHANFGPFAASAAQPHPGSIFSNIDTPHTAYNVTLPASGDAYHGAVLYRPAASGDHAFFLAPGVPLSLFTSGGAPVPLEREGTIPPELCALIERVGIAHLDETETYTVVYGPAPSASVQTIVEYLGEAGCEGCEHVHLHASRSFRPPNNAPAEAVLDHPIAFEIPAAIGITSGSACVGTVTFSFRSGEGPQVGCVYYARPHHADFRLLACSGGLRSGDDVEADYFRLAVNSVAALGSPVSVELELEDEACTGHEHEE
jgi:hypothetical protein